MNPLLSCLLGLTFTFAGNVDSVLADELGELLLGFEAEVPNEAEGELDQLLDGFADSVPSEIEQNSIDEPFLPDWLDLYGIFSLQSTVNFSHGPPKPSQPDYRGLSMLRGRGELIGDVSMSDWEARIGVKAFYDVVYSLGGNRDYFTAALLDEYEKEIEITEAYLQGKLSDQLDLKVGRQIVVWGKSDNIRITDILNPLDLRQPGMVDIRYIRLPVTMTKLDYYRNNWNLSGVLVNEPRFDKTPVYNSDFYPGKGSLPPVEKPGVNFENQQFGLALNGIFSGWDLSLYMASVFGAKANLEPGPAGNMVRKYNRVFMTGLAANVAFGNWLLKTEAAFWEGLTFSTITDEEKSRLDILLAFEYTGFSETVISVEVADRHLFDFDPRLEELPDSQKQDLVQYVVRYVRNFMNDTVQLTLLAASYGLSGDGGGFQRFQVEYDLADGLTLTGGVVLYQSGDYQPFSDIGDNDRFLLELEYRF